MGLLTKNIFRESDIELPEIQNFDCGSKPWQLEVSNWIKSPAGVLEDMRLHGPRVWLYRQSQGELVGFGSLGVNTWSFPPPNGKKHRISYIPFMGVARAFWQEPADVDRDERYSYQILDDLIECAVDQARFQHLYPAIGLSVDQRNTQAIAFYQNRDFVNAMCPRLDKTSGVTYERMFLIISDLVASPAHAPAPA